jgi:serine O-acetyltransferase
MSSVWEEIVEDAKKHASQDAFMAPILDKFIISNADFSSAITAILSCAFASGCVTQQQWLELFQDAYNPSGNDETHGAKEEYETMAGSILNMGMIDLQVFKERDPATDDLVGPLLNFKGYKALQSHRIAHILWKRGRKQAALKIQSRCSEVFDCDIHPAAILLEGLMIDHGCAVVIGETAVVGKNCTFLHGVTLGSTGKEAGDRHPKIGPSTLIGCHVTILGNIQIGASCKIGSNSIVLKPLPAGSTAVGSPARIVGKSDDPCAASSMDHALHHVTTSRGDRFRNSWCAHQDNSSAFDEVDCAGSGLLNLEQTMKALTFRYNTRPPREVVEPAFREADENGDGVINKCEFEEMVNRILGNFSTHWLFGTVSNTIEYLI